MLMIIGLIRYVKYSVDHLYRVVIGIDGYSRVTRFDVKWVFMHGQSCPGNESWTSRLCALFTLPNRSRPEFGHDVPSLDIAVDTRLEEQTIFFSAEELEPFLERLQLNFQFEPLGR